MKRPNILLLFTDQQRADTIATLGNPIIKTPSLDRLCREGTAFTRCYTPSPVCVPARAATACGLPPHRTGIVDNGRPPEAPYESFMQRLSASGYQTRGVGKMHFVPDGKALWGFDARDYSEEGAKTGGYDDFHRFLNEQGLSHVHDPHGVRSEMYYVPQPSQLPERLHHTRWVADRSIDFLNHRDQSQPFFLWSSFIKPHPPFESPTPWNKLYRAADMPEPRRFAGQEAYWTHWNDAQNRYKYRGAGYDALLMRTIAAAYYACISYIDYQVGRILDALGSSINDTLILFTSDHGELLGDYGCVGKRSMLDAAARIPMLARWPGHVPAGARCDAPATLLDIFPTTMHASGDDGPRPSGEGESLIDVANGRSSRDAVYSQFQHNGYGLYMAATSHEKYIYSEPDQREWFFDRRTDPLETNSDPTDARCRRLRSKLIRRFQNDGYTAPLNEDRWRSYRVRSIPTDPDAGLLYQDDPRLQSYIDGLGPGYARRISPDASQSASVLRPRYDDDPGR